MENTHANIATNVMKMSNDNVNVETPYRHSGFCECSESLMIYLKLSLWEHFRVNLNDSENEFMIVRFMVRNGCNPCHAKVYIYITLY